MFRTTDIALIGVMVAAAAFTYQVKHQAEDQLDEINKLQTQIRLEGDTIDVLKADWSLLAQPERLQKLAAIYQSQLQLQPVDAHQILMLRDLPVRPPVSPDAGSKQAGTVADSGQDKIVTGGVAQ